MADGREVDFSVPLAALHVTTANSFWHAVEATAAAGRLQNVAVEDTKLRNFEGWRSIMEAQDRAAEPNSTPYDLAGYPQLHGLLRDPAT